METLAQYDAGRSANIPAGDSANGPTGHRADNFSGDAMRQSRNTPGQSAAPGVCRHCNSPVRKSGDEFCCHGCQFVFETLGKLGLRSFYRLKTGDEAPLPALESSPNKTYHYLDDAGVQERLLTVLPENRRQVQFYLPTIHCAACVWLLERLPHFLAGVEQARVQFGAGRLEVVFKPDQLSLSQLASVLNSIGYPPVPYTPAAVEEEDKKAERQMLRRIGVAGLCASNTMMLAVSLFQGYFTGIEEPYRSLFRWLSAAIALPSVLYSAVPFYRTALGALFSGTLHIDLPISIAIVGATIAGFVSLATGGEYVYFDSITALIFLLLLGRYVQRRAIHRARASTATTWDLFPTTVRCIVEGRAFDKPLAELCVGDRVEIWPNERVPSDGVIESGSSSVESTFLTGESVPVPVGPGDHVLGGTLNIDGRLQVTVSETGEKTRLGKILAQLEGSQREKAPLENQVNRLSSAFVFGVLTLAVVTYAVWLFIDPHRAFDCAVAVLIVTCPCALGLAIPAAVTVAMAEAQKARLFIKRADALEALAGAGEFYFDKTGTLTEGRLSVTDAVITKTDLQAAYTLACFSPNHPVAAAVVQRYSPLAPVPMNDLALVPGRGVTGVLDGACYRFGSIRWLREQSVSFPPDVERSIRSAAERAASVVAVSKASELVGYFVLQDSIRTDAKALVSLLQEQGKKVFILSGDSSTVVHAVAEELDIPRERAFGELLPEQKAEHIARSAAATAFVGDGMNDAPAMRAASVGIGLRGGVEATLECADIFVADRELAGFRYAYDGALRTRATIRRNLRFAVAYNMLGAGAAVAGWVTPLTAAFVMPTSSLTVIISSITAKNFPERDKR
ncbi:MAG: heavy metal translocating P-type ATPase metal-binding domain-containing protein [Bdellovibrionota bacterium]